MTVVKVWLYLILHYINLDLGILNDEFYKKFYQTDYKINFERELVAFYNESYGEMSLRSFKYNRTHLATNTTILLNVNMGYDLEIIVQAYKFLSNEYRIFPLRFQYNYCKGLKYNIAGLKSCAEKCGKLNCPLKENSKYFVCNCIMDESKLPPLVPSGRFKIVLEGRYKNEIVAIVESYFCIYRPIAPGKRSG